MKRIFFLTGMLLLGQQLSAQLLLPPYSLADQKINGPVKTVTTFYEDHENGMHYVTIEHYNRKGVLESRTVNGEMRGGTTNYIFDKKGRLVGEEFSYFYSYKSTYTYDKKGCIVRKTTVTHEEEGDVTYDTVEYVNNKDCKPLFIKYRGSIDTLRYDNDGRLVYYYDGYSRNEFTYDADGNLVKQQVENEAGNYINRFTYDEMGWLSEFWLIEDGVETEHIQYTYSGQQDAYGNWFYCMLNYPNNKEAQEDLIIRAMEYYSE